MIVKTKDGHVLATGQEVTLYAVGPSPEYKVLKHIGKPARGGLLCLEGGLVVSVALCFKELNTCLAYGRKVRATYKIVSEAIADDLNMEILEDVLSEWDYRLAVGDEYGY